MDIILNPVYIHLIPSAVLYSGEDEITIIDRKAILSHVTIDQLIP